MKVEIRGWRGKRGEVTLVNGRAVGSTPALRHWLDSTTIIEDGTTEVVWPEDGERYLRALPRALRGAYTAAVLVEHGDESRVRRFL